MSRQQGAQQAELTQAIDDLMLAIAVLLGIIVGRRARFFAGPLAMVASHLGTWSAAVIGAATAQSASIAVVIIRRLEKLEARVAELEGQRKPREREIGS